MLRFIEKMRQRPENERKSFVFFVALTITGIIAVVWLFSIGSVFSEKIEKTSSAEGGTPFIEIGKAIRSAYAGIGEGINDFKNVLDGRKEEFTNINIERNEASLDTKEASN